ncbi:hypothetical protein M5D96_013300, partial [Drosophila gunungcola]
MEERVNVASLLEIVGKNRRQAFAKQKLLSHRPSGEVKKHLCLLLLAVFFPAHFFPEEGNSSARGSFVPKMGEKTSNPRRIGVNHAINWAIS